MLLPLTLTLVPILNLSSPRIRPTPPRPRSDGKPSVKASPGWLKTCHCPNPPRSRPAQHPQTAVLSFSGLAFLASGSDLQQGDYRWRRSQNVFTPFSMTATTTA